MIKFTFDPRRHTLYTPLHKEKYTGKYPLIMRSSWERRFARWCDLTEDVLFWSSESVAIRYFDPVKQKIRRYYPDFVIKTKNNEIFIVEIKPYKETLIPKNNTKRKKQAIIKENITYSTNIAKWNAAHEYCTKNGFQFKIITEKALPI